MISRLVVITVVLLVSAIGPSRAQDEQDNLVRLSYSSGWDALPALVGVDFGFFAAEDLVINGLQGDDTAGVIKSVVIGTSDFALLPQRAMLAMAASDFDFAVVSMNGWGTEMELVAKASDSATKSIKDLKGKTILVGSGSEALPVLIRLLNAAQMTLDDVTILRVPSGQLVEAFGQPDNHAIFDTRHYTKSLTDQKIGRVVTSNKGVEQAIGRIGAAPLIVNKDILENEPEKVQRFLNAWVRTLNFIREEPDYAAAVLQIFFHRQGLELDAELAKAWIGMTRYDRYTWTASDIADAEYNGWGLMTGRILRTQPKLKDYIDNSFAEAAAKQLN